MNLADFKKKAEEEAQKVRVLLQLIATSYQDQPRDPIVDYWAEKNNQEQPQVQSQAVPQQPTMAQPTQEQGLSAQSKRLYDVSLTKPGVNQQKQLGTPAAKTAYTRYLQKIQ